MAFSTLVSINITSFYSVFLSPIYCKSAFRSSSSQEGKNKLIRRDMEASVGLGFVAVFAVSGSIVLLANQVHKRLLSDFMKKIEYEMCGSEKLQIKKKVRFARDVMEPSSKNKEYRRRNLHTKPGKGDDHHQQCSKRENNTTMPLNRQVLYKGIIQYRSLQAQNYM